MRVLCKEVPFSERRLAGQSAFAGFPWSGNIMNDSYQSPLREGAGVGLHRFTLGSIAFALLMVSSVSAQTPEVAALRGRVVDQTGAAIAETNIAITNQMTGLHRETRTDGSGYYSIAALPLTGGYKLVATKAGFAAQEVADIELRAGETASIDITLRPAGSNSEVTVFDTAEGVRSDSPELGNPLNLQKIDETPIFGRNITQLPLLDSAVRPARGTGDLFLDNTLFVINGGGRRQTAFVIDGATGNDAWGRQTIFTNLPFSSIQEFTVLTNAFSAEHGWLTGAAINVVTKSGTNQYHGDLLALWRPPGIQARSPLAIRRTADRLGQFSGSLGGPIIKDATHFFASAEYDRQDRDSTITSPLAPGVFTGHARRWLLIGRVDHQVNKSNTLTGKFNFDRLADANPQDAVGGLNLPSTARVFRRRTYSAGIAETAAIGTHLLNEARFQAQFGSPITQFDPVTPSIQFVRPGIATEGESRSALLTNHQYQVVDTVSITKGSHFLKIGADAIHSTSGGNGQEFGGGFVLGSFTLVAGDTTPIPQLTIKDVARLTQSCGNATYEVKEWVWSVFAQDNVKVRNDLTLNLGLRYQQQTFTDDTNNVAPRIGFAYNPLGDRRTVLRGSYGIYYSEDQSNLAAPANINGPTGTFTFSAAPGQLGFPASLTPLTSLPAGAVLPPRDINILPGQRRFLSQFFDVSKLKGYPDKLLNPYTQQITFGIQRELTSRWILSVDYVHQRTIGVLASVDLNSPAPFFRTGPGQVRTAAAADLTRPIVPAPNGYRRIISTINSGDVYYDGVQTSLSKRFGNRFSLLFSYTYSHTIDTAEADVPSGQDANDPNFRGIFERASSVLDQRNRLVMSGWYQFPYQINVGAVATLASGRPFNVTTGVD